MNPTRPYHWLCLLAAIVFEVAGTTVMKLSFGWSFAHAALAGLVIMWIAIGLSYYSLAKATTGLPVGVAFAFWEARGWLSSRSPASTSWTSPFPCSAWPACSAP